MTDTQLRGMNMRELVIERDFTFIPKQHTDGEVPVDQDTDNVIDVEMKLLAVWIGLLLTCSTSLLTRPSGLTIQ